jgi:hypothetical protein
MATEEVRSTAAAALRDLNHAFAAHDPDDDVLVSLTGDAGPRDRQHLPVRQCSAPARDARRLANGALCSFENAVVARTGSDRAILRLIYDFLPDDYHCCSLGGVAQSGRALRSQRPAHRLLLAVMPLSQRVFSIDAIVLTHR